MALSNEGLEISKFYGEEEGLGFVRLTRGLGRKRILISKSNLQNLISHSDQTPVIDSQPVRRSKSETTDSNKSLLESLHQDILIRVLCHVDHDDLARLKSVSKTIRKAVLEAKKSHFDYSTPKKTLPFREALIILKEDSNSNSSEQDNETEPPNAPNRKRNTIRESDLSKISTVLFK